MTTYSTTNTGDWTTTTIPIYSEYRWDSNGFSGQIISHDSCVFCGSKSSSFVCPQCKQVFLSLKEHIEEAKDMKIWLDIIGKEIAKDNGEQ